ncbi:MAG: leucyl aminopeptidase [Magnetococcales bacterium]|nr:leucyl aminopeptidase [Magnetococcales bacterium]
MTDQPIKMDVTTTTPQKWRGNTLAIALYDNGHPQDALSECGEEVKKEVLRLIKEGWIKGKAGETLLIPAPNDSAILAKRLLLVGMGEEKKINPESLRGLGAQLAALCHKHQISTLNFLINLDKHNQIKRWKVMEALAEGVWLGSYRFDHYCAEKKEASKKIKPSKILFSICQERSARCRKLLDKVAATCRGVYLARDLGNQPGNLLTPQILAEQAVNLANNFPIKTTVLTEKALIKKKMNGILAVGQGSQNSPRLITMEYRKGGDKPLLAVVGKAVTFDSGGISLKSANKMEEMKFDMCGGAAVFGFMQAIAEMKLPLNVVGIVPAAENLPSSTAQRPGDIIQTAKGLFVEVINTDAEGRLILADALHHAESFNPAVTIDLATLTGACVVALGSHASGIMGNSDTLLRSIQKIGDNCGDRVWPLPLFDAYQEQIRSTVADIKNVGGPGGGTSTAGCFLSRFVDEKRRWAHIDIAGTAWDMSGSKPHFPKGATGVGVRLLCQYAEKFFV